MTLDHVVILVTDLTQAIQEYTARGFTVTPGGEHTGGITHNALIAFADGTYLELLAFKPPAPTTHRWDRYRRFPGPIDYCLGFSSVADALHNVQKQGLSYSGPYDGGRLRPDGIELRWRSGSPSDQERGLPFMIEDVTPRSLRVPGGTAIQHANRVSGIGKLAILVNNLAQAQQDFSTLLGAPKHRADESFVCNHNGITYHVTMPTSTSPQAKLLQTRGPGPWQLTLRVEAGGEIVI